MEISIIVACARNGVIGADNSMPWHLPEDLKHFKALTMGKPMIMGRKTFESIGSPLPGRTSIVVTRQSGWHCEGAFRAGSVDEAIKIASGSLSADQQEVMIIGGAEIYRIALPRVTTIYLTEVALEPEGDAFFPEIDRSCWREMDEVTGTSTVTGVCYRFVTLCRKT